MTKTVIFKIELKNKFNCELSKKSYNKLMLAGKTEKEIVKIMVEKYLDDIIVDELDFDVNYEKFSY